MNITRKGKMIIQKVIGVCFVIFFLCFNKTMAEDGICIFLILGLVILGLWKPIDELN